jgi:hypothetical protein
VAAAGAAADSARLAPQPAKVALERHQVVLEPTKVASEPPKVAFQPSPVADEPSPVSDEPPKVALSIAARMAALGNIGMPGGAPRLSRGDDDETVVQPMAGVVRCGKKKGTTRPPKRALED